jgi:hypothetical protein
MSLDPSSLPKMNPEQKGCVAVSFSHRLTGWSARCELDANHPGLSPGMRGSGIEAGLRRLTPISRDCDKADFPSQPSCEMRVGVSFCGKNALEP